ALIPGPVEDVRPVGQAFPPDTLTQSQAGKPDLQHRTPSTGPTLRQPTGEPQGPVGRPATDSPWLPNCNHVPPAYVEIGRNSYYDPHTVRFVTHGPAEKIIIGKYCSIGPFTNICTGGMHLIDLVSNYSFEWAFLGPEVAMKRYRPPARNTEIGSDVWVGT